MNYNQKSTWDYFVIAIMVLVGLFALEGSFSELSLFLIISGLGYFFVTRNEPTDTY